MKEYFDLLGIAEDADATTIKKAFRKKAMLLHPDRNKDPNAEDAFIRLNEAYEYLIDGRTGKSFVNIDISDYVNPERERAKAFARMRYEEFIARNKAFDRLSIHRLFWGRKITWLLIIISSILVYDQLASPQFHRIYNKSSIFKARARLTQTSVQFKEGELGPYLEYAQRHPEHYEREVLLTTTPLLKFINEYRTGSEQFRHAYPPAFSMRDYDLLPYAVLILSVMTLFCRFKNFEQKVAVKIISIIAIFSYLLAFLATT